jgi:hypothetical protein
MDQTNKNVKNNRPLERTTGLVLLLIAFLAVVSILTNLDVNPDYTSVREDITYLGENLPRLAVNTYLWLLNGMLVILLGPLLMTVFLPSLRPLPLASAFMISSTGIIYLFYAIHGFSLLQYTRDFMTGTEQATDFLAYFSLNAIIIRQKLQLAAITTSGISTILIGSHIIHLRQLPAFIGWFILIGGLIYAVFSWFGMQNLIFSAGRMIFILSLIISGSYLMLSGIKTSV